MYGDEYLRQIDNATPEKKKPKESWELRWYHKAALWTSMVLCVVLAGVIVGGIGVYVRAPMIILLVAGALIGYSGGSLIVIFYGELRDKWEQRRYLHAAQPTIDELKQAVSESHAEHERLRQTLRLLSPETFATCSPADEQAQWKSMND